MRVIRTIYQTNYMHWRVAPRDALLDILRVFLEEVDIPQLIENFIGKHKIVVSLSKGVMMETMLISMELL